MAKESTQHKLDRVRKPRVQITYDVEVNGAMQLKELPFVVGVMGDFSGNPDQPLPALKDRRFVEVDRDNFNKVLGAMSPRLTYRVDDKISGQEGKQLNVELRFSSMDDFNPENVVKQVEPLSKLLEARERLKSLMARMDGNDKLESLLEDVLKDTQMREQLGKSLGVDASGTGAEGSGDQESN